MTLHSTILFLYTENLFRKYYFAQIKRMVVKLLLSIQSSHFVQFAINTTMAVSLGLGDQLMVIANTRPMTTPMVITVKMMASTIRWPLHRFRCFPWINLS